MARPLVGIYATIAPASWGPWHDRPSLLAPVALGAALQRAGAMVAMLAPDPGLERVELLRTLDALVVLAAGGDDLAALLEAAQEIGLRVRVLDAAQLTSSSSIEDFEAQISGVV